MNRYQLNELVETIKKGNLLYGIEVQEKPLARKRGFTLVPVIMSPTIIGWEFVEDESSVPDGDYQNPIPYTQGMTVETGKFYYIDYLGKDLPYEAIKTGIPLSFYDRNYFDVIG